MDFPPKRFSLHQVNNTFITLFVSVDGTPLYVLYSSRTGENGFRKDNTRTFGSKDLGGSHRRKQRTYLNGSVHLLSTEFPIFVDVSGLDEGIRTIVPYSGKDHGP